MLHILLLIYTSFIISCSVSVLRDISWACCQFIYLDCADFGDFGGFGTEEAEGHGDSRCRYEEADKTEEKQNREKGYIMKRIN